MHVLQKMLTLKEARKDKRKEEKRLRKQRAAERQGEDELTPGAPHAAAAIVPRECSVAERREAAWDAWRRFGEPQIALAPMVCQQNLPGRV